MQLLFFCPRWGSENLGWDSFCKKAKESGYDGIESGVPFDQNEKQEMLHALARHGLQLIGQYWHSFEKDFIQHKNAYTRHLQHLVSVLPVKIDAQTGKDYFSFEQNKELFEIAAAFTSSTGITIAHETHRNKALFSSHITKNYLEKIPSLTITADFSHWCAVAESYLEDQQESVTLAIQHSVHIHARVGHTQGPQVTDPRFPEWKEALQYHTNWWKEIFLHHKKKGSKQFTITPEFGPAPYMQHDPITKLPLADQWGINQWMMEYLKKELQ